MRMKNNVRIFVLLLVIAMTLSACSLSKPNFEKEDQKSDVITQKHAYTQTPYVDYSLKDLPEFVDSIEACIDPEKQYVLPNGYLYEHQQIVIPYATNQLQSATDVDGSVFNGTGYQNNARIRSTLEITEYDYGFVTGFIPVEIGDTIYLSDGCFDPQNEQSDALNIAFYNADKDVVAQASMRNSTDEYFEILEVNENGFVTSLLVSEWFLPDELAYVRFSLFGSGDQQVISVNEDQKEVYSDFVWKQTEKYISPSWYTEIKETIDTVNSIELKDPTNAVAFLFAADIHLDPESTTAYVTPTYTDSIGKVSAEVMRGCNIPFFVTGGDNSTQSSGFMPSDFENNMEDLLAQMSPIPQKNILLSLGNHDGATGIREENGEELHYRFQLDNEKRSAVFFDWQRASNEYKHFDSDGTYYYLDDSATKTRYIIMNAFWSQWEGDEDGFVPNIQHSFFHTPLFGAKQLKWLAEEALDLPKEYAAVVIVHDPDDAKDSELFCGIIDAFNNKSTYQGSYVGEEEWQSATISVNYDLADGEIISVFQGHNHSDAQYEVFKGTPCIGVTTAGAYWAVRNEYEMDRVKGTSSEFAVDVVVIDKADRKIYLTRLGAGYDRVISY